MFSKELARNKFLQENPNHKWGLVTYSKAWRARNPNKLKAHRAVFAALRNGTLTRLPCEVCQKTAEAHHTDYQKPLEVRWLCKEHHVAEHKKMCSNS